MLFVGTSIIHPSTEGVFLLCNILDLLIYSFHLIFLFLFHICKPLHSLRKLCNRLIRISVLDAVAHAVLDMALEDNLSYFMKCRFCRLDLRQDILARHILIHPYGRSPALDR